MKKSKLILAVVLGMALAMGVSAKTFITIGSGGTTGTYYPTTVGIAVVAIQELNAFCPFIINYAGHVSCHLSR